MRNVVYRNLHKKCWSVKVNDRVAEHASSLVLENVKFRVQPGGRARVLREKKKFVHAFADGNRLHGMIPIPNDCVQVKYNPYKAGYFYRHDNGEPIYTAKLVFFLFDGEVFAVP